MDQAEKAPSSNFSRALQYRDGLIIALLAADPLRLNNITTLELGRTLIKDGTTWSFNIPAEATKGVASTSPSCQTGALLASIGMLNTTVCSSVMPSRPTGSGSANLVDRLPPARSIVWSASGRLTPSASELIRICSGPAWQPAPPSITGPRSDWP